MWFFIHDATLQQVAKSLIWETRRLLQAHCDIITAAKVGPFTIIFHSFKRSRGLLYKA